MPALEGSRSGQKSFHPHDIKIVRCILLQHPDWNRQKLSLYLCQLWNWRGPDGTFKDSACLYWLRRLEKKGLIQLPPSSRSPRPFPSSSVSFQPPVVLNSLPSSFSLQEVVVRPIIHKEWVQWKSLMNHCHYLGFSKTVGEAICHVATVGSSWVALLAFAAAAWKSALRETYIGWSESVKLKRLYLVANNIRFLILPGIFVKNLASKVLALSLKRLSFDWENR